MANNYHSDASNFKYVSKVKLEAKTVIEFDSFTMCKADDEYI